MKECNESVMDETCGRVVGGRGGKIRNEQGDSRQRGDVMKFRICRILLWWDLITAAAAALGETCESSDDHGR